MTQTDDRPVRAVLFDFGGVIAEEGFKQGLQAIARAQGLDAQSMPRLAMEAVYDSGYVTGRGSEQAFWALLRRRTGLRGDDAALREEILSRFRVRPWMMDLVRRLHEAGYRVGLLSDQTDWLERLDAQQGFLPAFDRLFISYRLGKGKRDPSLFREVAESLGLPAGQILFVDDDPGNIERARDQGFRVLLFTTREAMEERLGALLR